MTLAQDTRTLVFSCKDLEKVSVGRPSVVTLSKGQTFVSCDLTGPGLKTISGKKGKDLHSSHFIQGRIFASDASAESWCQVADYPFGHARLFRDGPALYALGHVGNLKMLRSSDGGATWGKPSDLTTATGRHNRFVLGPSNVLIHNGKIHAALTVLTDLDAKGLRASVHAQIIATATAGSSIDKASAWQFVGEEAAFRDLVPIDGGYGCGIPFYEVPRPDRGVDLAKQRWVNRIGWNEAHLAHIADPNHLWHRPGGVHMLASAYSHRANTTVLMRAEGGELHFERSPAGQPLTYMPLPGGHQKFDLLWDEPSKRHWLVSNLCIDSMRRVETLKRERPGLPVDERHSLALYHSTNLVDWVMAGVVAREDLIYEPAMAVRGDDLVVVARTGTDDLARPLNTQEIVQYSVAGFRSLI